MILSAEQQAMADGKYGKGTAMAMEIQIAVGEGFEAKRMVPISKAHVSLSAQEADVWFAEKLYQAGAKCRISPTVNPGYSLDYFCSQELLDQRAVENMVKTEQVYKQLGATLTYSCTPLPFWKYSSLRRGGFFF